MHLKKCNEKALSFLESVELAGLKFFLLSEAMLNVVILWRTSPYQKQC